MIALFGGAAGTGKTTIARLWCESRRRSVHIQLDEIRDLIVSGRAEPQVLTVEQRDQYSHCVSACTALARSYAANGYDVAIDDVFEPEPTRKLWLPQLHGLDVCLVALHPPLEVVMARMAGRQKQVFEEHIRSQHDSISRWPVKYRVDNGELTTSQTLKQVVAVLESASLEQIS